MDVPPPYLKQKMDNLKFKGMESEFLVQLYFLIEVVFPVFPRPLKVDKSE